MSQETGQWIDSSMDIEQNSKEDETDLPITIEAPSKYDGIVNKSYEADGGDDKCHVTSISEDERKDVDDVSLEDISEGGVEEEEEEDPWNAAFKAKIKVQTPWEDLSTRQKVFRVAYDWIFLSLFKVISVLALLYVFVCSLQIMSAAFQLLGGKAAGKALTESEIVNNPVGGLMMGVLVTVLVQSSSTSTSIIVSMVGAGVLTVEQAIPFIMGCNIGTSVTNTIVAVTQAKDRNQFRRAFGGATVHDMFNWLSVAILLPLEVQFGILYLVSESFLGLFNVSPNDNADIEFLDAITKPVTSHIVQINKEAITDIAINGTDADDVSLLMRCEPGETGDHCNHIFAYSDLTDAAVGGILLAGSLLVLTSVLILLVKVLQWILQGPRAIKLVRKALNADFPGVFSVFTGYFAMLVGAGITFLVQSSSVFTSAMTPLVGMGLITLKRMYPLTLGSNIGTTGTSILAALAQPTNFLLAMQVSLCHLFFNLFGITIWYPIPFMRNVPIKLAMNLGNNTSKYRWFAFVYLISVFFLIPMSVFALSLAGTTIFLAVGVPIFCIFAIIVFINIMQAKASRFLPKFLRDWKFLPEPLRSLRPYDKPFSQLGRCCTSCCKKSETEEEVSEGDDSDYLEMKVGVEKSKDQSDIVEIVVETPEIVIAGEAPKTVDCSTKDELDAHSIDSGMMSSDVSAISGQLSTSPSTVSLLRLERSSSKNGK